MSLKQGLQHTPADTPAFVPTSSGVGGIRECSLWPSEPPSPASVWHANLYGIPSQRSLGVCLHTSSDEEAFHHRHFIFAEIFLILLPTWVSLKLPHTHPQCYSSGHSEIDTEPCHHHAFSSTGQATPLHQHRVEQEGLGEGRGGAWLTLGSTVPPICLGAPPPCLDGVR